MTRPGARVRRWWAPALTITLLVAGTIAVTLAITLGLAGSDAEPSPAKQPTTPSSEPTPATSSTTASGAVSELADPAWVERAAETTGIPRPALAAYAGASLAAEAARPGCGLGWNTLAAIGMVGSAHGTAEASGPMAIDPDAWAAHATDGSGDGVPDIGDLEDSALTVALHLCATGNDLTQSANWNTAVAAHNAEAGYAKRVAEASRTYAAAVAAEPTSRPGGQ